MNPRTAAQAQQQRIMELDVLPSEPEHWTDENGREWDTAEGHPIPTGHDREHADGEMRGRMTDPEQIVKFCLAGSATITLVSLKTQKRYTFKVKRPDDFDATRPIWFVSVLKGSDNDSDFGYIGQIVAAGRHYTRGRKCWKDWYTASAAFAWFWDHVRADEVPEVLEVWHEGRCGRCNRKLTVPESVASGFGPECIQHV